MDDLSALRAEVERMRRAATRKVSRLKTARGVEVSGTEFDPRRGTQTPNTYNATQLNAYRNKLSKFLSRNNQYVPDVEKRPIPQSEWDAYKRRENRYRQTAGQVYEQVKDITLPSGETVRERLSKMDAVHKQMHNTVMNPIFDPHNRSSGDIVDRKALAKLSKSLSKNSTKKSVATKVQMARDQSRQMIDVIGDRGMTKQLDKLSDNQFIALWNYTTFASNLALNYSSARKMLSDKESPMEDDIIRQQSNDAKEMVSWAKGLKL